MPAYLDEKRRRIGQFAECLRRMGLRRHKIVKRSDCFIVFDETAPEDNEASPVQQSAAARIDCRADGGPTNGGDDRTELPPKGSSPRQSSRFIQFAFLQDSFYLELPNNTLFPQEAEQILRYRRGFYWARGRPDLHWVRANWEDMVEWDPLQKVYLYRDEESAAEDMGFILFQVWKFPVDWPWYLRAASFHTDHQFEQGKPLD